MYNPCVPFEFLLTQTLKMVQTDNREFIRFITESGKEFYMNHDQDCCERVEIEDIDGDLQRLIGSPILLAEEVSNQGENGEWGDTCTWTFYKLSMVNDSVTIRWYGSSNGYYSERVNFRQIISQPDD